MNYPDSSARLRATVVLVFGLGLAVPLSATAQASQAGAASVRFVAAGMQPAAGIQSVAAGMRLAAASAARVETAAEPFWDALRLDDVKRLQTEMLRGAGANAIHPELGPAIVVAARERSPKVLAYLAGLSGTRVDATNAIDETALMLVALHGDLDSARLLVERGAQVNRQGWTPLHYAASAGHLSTIEFLLGQNAYIDAQSPNRTTPLMMAARHKHMTAVELLLDAGADPTPRNEAGYAAADYLAAHGEHEAAQGLREQAAAFARKHGHPAGSPASSAGSAVSPSDSTASSPSGSAANPVEATTSPVAPRPRLPGSRD